MPLTLEMHHLEQVSEGGTDEPTNLLCLCPNCHTMHHNGIIPLESLRTWKHVLLSLNEAYDRNTIDMLLTLHRLRGLPLTGDGVLRCSTLLASGLVDVVSYVNGKLTGTGPDIFNVFLSPKGIRFVEAWLAGNERAAYETAA
jgi:HNH endonuclease